MAHIDPFVYVARPDLLSLDGEAIDYAELDGALARDASGATAITVLGGYYSPDALVSLCRNVPSKPACRRRQCRVRIVVGLEAFSTLAQTWELLQKVRETLHDDNFQDVEVGVIPSLPVHFHTKLFGFLKSTQPIWYIGSANPGSERHEMMVRVAGRHEALSMYAEAAVERALSVKLPPPSSAISTVRAFMLSGVLAHKPPVQRLFTFDAFRLSPSQRAALDRVIGRGMSVPHASPRTEGFGFSLESALGFKVKRPVTQGVPPVNRAASGQRRVRHRESCIDTVLGLWMPDVYAEDLRTGFLRAEAKCAGHLAEIDRRFSSMKRLAEVRKGFDAHVAALQRVLKSNRIDARPIDNHVKAFNDFLEARKKLLKNEEARIRHARMMIVTPMPDIWRDPRAAGRFEESFFADLAYRAGQFGGNKGRVIRSIRWAVDGYGMIATDDEFRKALESRLAELPWTLADWIL